MALLKLSFKVGINRDRSNYSGEGGWWACDKIRFRGGFPEKLGGWEKYSASTYFGVCRQLLSWVTTYRDVLVGVGTNLKLYLELGGTFNDITPLRATFVSPATNNSISVVSGQTTVTVALTDHGALAGDFVTVSGVVGSVGGIPAATLNANHQITTADTDNFTFTVATAATSTVPLAGGTAITMKFEIHVGSAVQTFGYGWGVGFWSRNAWGQGATQPVSVPQRDWWFDNFDNDLYANIRGGAPYVWVRGNDTNPTSALGTRAISLQAYASSFDPPFDPDAVPAVVTQLMVSQQDRHLIAFGAVPFGSTNPDDFDPLLIRWADQDTPADWTPTVTNSAGFLRVSRGSRIITASPSRQEILVWTDVGLNSLQFLGTTDVFGLQEYANDTTIISPRAKTSASGVVYWMGRDKFYTYAGRVETLNCTLLTHVFNNINRDQLDQVCSGTMEQWGEIWWFYPSTNASYNDSYVVYNYLEKMWFYGTIDRTAWMDSQLLPYPLGANGGIAGTGQTGLLNNHEVGVDADGLPMESYIESNSFDLGDGDKFMLTRRLIPDFDFAQSETATPQVEMTLVTRNFPGSAAVERPEDTKVITQTVVGQYTEQVFVRARARQVALKVASDQLGVHWNLGSPRLDVREDGMR
jgi:hypothetical protein